MVISTSCKVRDRAASQMVAQGSGDVLCSLAISPPKKIGVSCGAPFCTMTSRLETFCARPRGPPPAIPKNDHTRETRAVRDCADCSPFRLASPAVPELCAVVTGIAYVALR
jgi:hypothetical protein